MHHGPARLLRWQLLSQPFIIFLEHIKHMHLFVHCWFAVAGYVGPGGWCSPWGKSLPQILSDTDPRSNTVTSGTGQGQGQGRGQGQGQGQVTKTAEACSKLDPRYEGEDPGMCRGEAHPLGYPSG